MELVAPKGLLVFSVHGVVATAQERPISARGISYEHWSESDTLNPEIYGMSYVTDAFVAQAISQACGLDAASNFKVFRRGLFESQDLYVIGGSELDIAGLNVMALPLGGFCTVGLVDQPWSGWAIEPNPGLQIIRADLFIEDCHVAPADTVLDNLDIMKFFPGSPNPAVRWSFEPVKLTRDSVIRVELSNTLGQKAYCYALAPASPGDGAPHV